MSRATEFTTGRGSQAARNQEVGRALDVLFQPGDVVEVRIPKPKGRKRTISGYFDDFDALAAAVRSWDGRCEAVYVTLNLCKPELLARSANRLTDYAEYSTADTEILRRRWLLVDCDPVRPAHISASDEEHQAALKRTRQVHDWLRSEGWPEPVLADSGNGGHLLYRIDLFVNDGRLVERVIKALAFLFDDERVKIDQGVFNPARIVKLYGTMACKGDSLPDRPHRRSRMLEVPEHMQIVERELLEQSATRLPDEPQSDSQQREADNSFDLEEWIRANNLPVVSRSLWQGGRKWILNPCPWNPTHNNRAAFIVQLGNGAIAAGCHHNGCEGKDWADLRDSYEPGWRETRGGGSSTHASAGTQSADEKGSQADRLAKLAEDPEITLFHDSHGDAFARFRVAEHVEIRPCRSKDFRHLLALRFYKREGKVPNTDAMNAALGVVEARAVFQGPEHALHNRVAIHELALWYDLADKRWRAIRIAPEGWRIEDTPPILFRRYRHQSAQVDPIQGGDLRELLRFVNVADPNGELLVLVYVVSCLIPGIAHPIPVLHGPQGAAKTTLFRIIRQLVDPSNVEVLSFPRDNAELVQQLSHHWMPLYDNLSGMPDWISDVLCRTVTGEGFTKRELYTNDDDVVYSFRRCVGLNGINVAAHKPDLLDRCIVLGLEPIPSDKRRSEQEFWASFEDARPRLFGAMLDALSRAMRLRWQVKLPQLPRMADFALWGCAIAEALGHGTSEFLNAFDANLSARNEEVLVSSPVATAVLHFMDDKEVWQGEPSQLLEILDSVAEAHRINTKCSSWPKAAHILTRWLNEVRTNLAAAGIVVDQSRGQRRMVTIRKLAGDSVESVSVAQSQRLDDDATVDAVAGVDPEASPLNQDTGEYRDASDACDATLPQAKERELSGTIAQVLEQEGLPYEVSPGVRIKSIEPYATVEARSALSRSDCISRPARERLRLLGISSPYWGLSDE